MLQAQSKANGVHKSRPNGEAEDGSMAMVAPPQLADEVSRVMKAIHSGQVHERASLQGFQPEECELLRAVNRALDSLTAPLTIAIECLGQLSQGKIPEKITANFAGELNAARNNLNACVDALGCLNESSRVVDAADGGQRLWLYVPWRTIPASLVSYVPRPIRRKAGFDMRLRFPSISRMETSGTTWKR